MRLDLLAAFNRERVARRSAALVTNLASGQQRLVTGDELTSDPLSESLIDKVRTGRSGLVEHEGVAWFITVQEPPVRLVIIGAVHISQSLAKLAAVVGIDVTIVDPRTAFATSERFPDTRILPEWPQDALAGLVLDRFTAVAALTHDPKIDDPALVAAVAGECFYVGALGSRRSHAARLERLRSGGMSEDDLGRIRAPIGLDIGAVSPAEIAVSIIGEVVAGLRRKPTRAEAAKARQPFATE